MPGPSVLSTLKDLLHVSKVAVGAVPLVGTQLQAIFELAEMITDKVEVRELVQDNQCFLLITFAIGFAPRE